MISVIVGTRNRAASLHRTLLSLASMTTPDGLAWEVIVVDNGSQDHTAKVVEQFIRTSEMVVRYVFERTRGIARALNRGMQAARGTIVAIVDDDVLVDASWLTHVHREFETDPSLGLLTGRVVTSAPSKPDLATVTSTDRTAFRFPSNPRRVGSNNNMALRTSLIRAIGLFDHRLGLGSGPWGGEDTDFVYRALKAGQKVLYSPTPQVFHDHDRSTPDQARARRLVYVRGWGAVMCKHAIRGDRWMAGMLVSETGRFLRLALGRGRPDRVWALRRLLALYDGAVRWIGVEIREWRGGRRGDGP